MCPLPDLPMFAALLWFLSLPPSLDAYSGRYVLVPQESADVQRVIEETVRQFNFLIRPIARGRLQKTNLAFPAIEFRRGGSDNFIIWHEKGTAVEHRAVDDRVPAEAPDGAKITVRLVAGPPLKEFYESGEGRRENTYELSPDGESLKVHVQIVSERLRSPIVYRLVYRRARS